MLNENEIRDSIDELLGAALAKLASLDHENKFNKEARESLNNAKDINFKLISKEYIQRNY